MVRRILYSVLLAFFVPMLSGCDEEFLRTLTPEQRAVMSRLWRTSEDPSITVIDEQPQQSLRDSFARSDRQAAVLPERLSGEEATGFSLEAVAAEDSCSSLLVGPPRGLSCLHCNHDRAHQQALLLSTLLFRSCLENVALNYLVDGTFGFNPDLMKQQIMLLTSGQRRLFVYFYLTNGATQRRWSSTTIDSFGVRSSPDTFRREILTDDELRYRYQALIMRLLPVLRFAQERGAVISLLPMLEDNLDRESFEAVGELTLETLPVDLHVAVGRSPCPNCYAGNDAFIPEGYFFERHTASPYIDHRNGVVSNDGTTYRFQGGAGVASLADLRSVRDAASATDNAFLLWSASRQGLPDQMNRTFLHPDEREYELPSLAERHAILQFLREGYSTSNR
ncbi:MAG: hypothetical protein KDD69_13645 [Bdellovibrionales bacterium]|nr:hypothetical protein [Bdellovibrionales bacterium]